MEMTEATDLTKVFGVDEEGSRSMTLRTALVMPRRILYRKSP
jgi:hypothetical protein